MINISIIILTFNSSEHIKSCLDSVFRQSYRNFEAILVDNGSIDDTLSLVKRDYPKVRLVENKRNLGACAARNKAIGLAKGRWILTLDCDVILKKDFIEKIVGFIGEAGESIGMFQPKILQIDRKTIYSCGIYLSNMRRFHDIGRGIPENGRFDMTKDIFGACSAAAVYKKQMLEEIKETTGYFDERFFFLVEDVDLAWRAQRKGWGAKFYSEAVCYHYGNSSGSDKKLRQFLSFRNRYYTIIKNEGLRKYIKKFFPLLCYDFPRLVYLFFTNKYILRTVKDKVSISLKGEFLHVAITLLLTHRLLDRLLYVWENY